ncbi:TPA: hypothetical protein ACOEXB_000898 [Yersinia enterocolitica]
MIAPQSLARSNSCPSRIPSDKSPAPNKSALAGNLVGVSITHSQPCPVSSGGGIDSGGVFRFDSNSANGQPLGEVNNTRNMGVLFNSLQRDNPKIGDFKTFTKVMTQGCERDLRNSTLAHGIKSALALFDALPADKQNKSLIDKACKFHKAMEQLTEQPDNTSNKHSAYKALKILTSDLFEKMGLSEKTGQAGNLNEFCSNYLKESVYPDVISKLEGKLSPERLDELRKNPEKVVEHLYAGQNQTSNTMIETLKTEFFEHKNAGDKAVKMFSLIAALEQKTQIIAGLMSDIADPGAPASPVVGLAAGNDIGHLRSADGNHAANPVLAAPNTTYNYNTTYNAPSPASNNISTTNINLSGTEVTTKPENNQPQSMTASQATADSVDSSTQSLDEIDGTPALPATDNLKYAASANTSAVNKSLNSSGTLYGMKGPAPSWLGTGSKVTLTNDGQVRDLSQKQDYGQDDVEQKQPTSVNAHGTLFVGMGNAPTSRSTGETQQVRQDAAQVSYKADLLVPGKKPNFITTLDIQVNSDGTLQQTTDDIYHATPAKVVAEKHLNAQGTSFGMKVGATSASTQSGVANNDSAVILTQQGAQTRDLSKQLAYKLGDTQPKSSSAVNAQGNQFVGFGGNSSAATQSWLANNDAQVTLTERGAQTRDLSQKTSYRNSDTNAVNAGRSQSNKQPTESE